MTRVSQATRRRLEQASGGLAATSVAAMTQQLPWFRRLSADQRAGVLLVTQTGVTNFVAWLGEPGETIRLTADAFRIAPRDLARRISLRQTVELVRVAIEAFEDQLPLHAADDRERRLLTEGILRFGREIAFAAASVYASAAESRGAWDARLEALVVDGVVRGEVDDALLSRSSALGWDAEQPVTVLVGSPPSESRPEPLVVLRRTATRLGRSVLLGVQGARLVALLSGTLLAPPRHVDGPAKPDPATRLADTFGPGPVVIGPTAPSLALAHTSARDALQGLRAAAGWADAPRPVHTDDLLPERALAGDPHARAQLIGDIVAPLAEAGGELTRTLGHYLDNGCALESSARTLFVHANTVRYRLRRVSEITRRDPTDPRDALVLRIALIVGRLAPPSEPTLSP
ncbi:PucR family transcriptional regulator [Pseudonocardia spinosispora]|uniref:PucR family transcriptional regulator n=1 Tax=Pseudonocardia spinosispora TaxID=103441 RepID=UPI0009FD0159|nr:helix-turn-helix domain-containing protein [Pseudonocardia spinosispora]